MKKKTKQIEKSISRTAGEVIGTIGHGISIGTDKLAQRAGFDPKRIRALHCHRRVISVATVAAVDIP